MYFLIQVALKIIRHCYEEGPSEIAQGVLLGLVVDKKLEITHCFPYPRADDDDFDEGMRMVFNVSIIIWGVCEKFYRITNYHEMP